jgi:hypothetical protein
MYFAYTVLTVALCVSNVFTQHEKVANTPDVLALMNRFNTCRFQTVMCCYTKRAPEKRKGERPADNTDVCAAQGVMTNNEGATHCHGFTWAGRDSNMSDENKRKLLNYINNEDHFAKRGYYDSIGEYNKCDCVENMPVVTRSDCSELNGPGRPKACDPRNPNGSKAGRGNNLRFKYLSLGGSPTLFDTNLVMFCKNSPKVPPTLPDRSGPGYENAPKGTTTRISTPTPVPGAPKDSNDSKGDEPPVGDIPEGESIPTASPTPTGVRDLSGGSATVAPSATSAPVAPSPAPAPGTPNPVPDQPKPDCPLSGKDSQPKY